jgi:hypothetical protein
MIDYQIETNNIDEFKDVILDYFEVREGKYIIRTKSEIISDKIVPLCEEDFGMRFEGENFFVN